jgi:L-rhamnose mutarotase
MQRYGMTIRLKPEAEALYRQHHQAVWPDVLDRIKACNISNYSIFLHAGRLFGYFEYSGDNFAEDMKKMADDARTQEWWAIMNPMQDPLSARSEGEWWASMEEVFHLD